jgi:hypothetical protein
LVYVVSHARHEWPHLTTPQPKHKRTMECGANPSMM